MASNALSKTDIVPTAPANNIGNVILSSFETIYELIGAFLIIF